ncbi:MAG: polysaccharide deacetylase family protein [Bacteroidales bacterium]|nr:polysaccharide deacetylase family protein [Bacteroidales bacterium]
MKHKPLASISLDLDNKWSYMKTHGDENWINYPSYYSIFVPYILEILEELDIKITFFIVGQDAVSKENKAYLKQIADAGHDFGNHTFNHEVWINQYSREEVETELENAEKAIFLATGKKVRGFRGPGFSWSYTLLEVLHDKGYLYDASTLPTFIGPFARMYYYWKSDFTKEEKKKRKSLFGKFSEGFRHLKPYYLKITEKKKILEIPVTTMPVFRIPFHMSYLLYISNISPALMRMYLHFSIFMCKITRTPISFLLHPLDIIGGDKITELAFFPGMNMQSEKKIKVFEEVIRTLKKHFELVDLKTHARSFSEKRIKTSVEPELQHK